MNLKIRPGSYDVAKEAKDLFGISKVVMSTEFRGPVLLSNLSDDEASLAKEYFAEQGKKVEESA
jgi:hypothetical protein